MMMFVMVSSSEVVVEINVKKTDENRKVTKIYQEV